MGSIRSSRALPPSEVSSASTPPRVSTENVAREPAASASCTPRTPAASPRISAARAYSLSVGHAFDFDEDGDFGQRRVRHCIAHEYIGRAMHALFQRAVPGFADARRVQRPSARPRRWARRRRNRPARRRRAGAVQPRAPRPAECRRWSGRFSASGRATRIGCPRRLPAASSAPSTWRRVSKAPEAGPPVSTTSSTGRSLGQTVRPAASDVALERRRIEHHGDRRCRVRRRTRAEHVVSAPARAPRPAPGHWRRRAHRWHAPAPAQRGLCLHRRIGLRRDVGLEDAHLARGLRVTRANASNATAMKLTMNVRIGYNIARFFLTCRAVPARHT